MYRKRRVSVAGPVLTILTCLMALALVLAVFGFLFDYSLDTYVGKDIPWYGDCVAGTITAPLTTTVAVVGYVLVQCDMPEPIFYPPKTDG